MWLELKVYAEDISLARTLLQTNGTAIYNEITILAVEGIARDDAAKDKTNDEGDRAGNECFGGKLFARPLFSFFFHFFALPT